MDNVVKQNSGFAHNHIKIFLFCKCSSLISLIRFLEPPSIQTYPLLSENVDPSMNWKEPVILIPMLTNKSGFVPEFHLSSKHHWNYCIGHKSCSIHTHIIHMQSVYIYIHALKYIGMHLFSHSDVRNKKKMKQIKWVPFYFNKVIQIFQLPSNIFIK